MARIYQGRTKTTGANNIYLSLKRRARETVTGISSMIDRKIKIKEIRKNY